MIYFCVTTSIYNKCPIRECQYITGITTLKRIIQNLNIEDCKIIIIENNGVRNTILDTLGCEVFYTNNNFLDFNNNGYKELQDVVDCIHAYNIKDNDFIVKMTGRYILNDDSEFMYTIKNLKNYECVIKYGSFVNPVDYKMDDCITGLIGMSSKYVKLIEKPLLRDCVEWKWGKVTRLIDDTNIYKVNKLGINICPGSNNYFMV